MLLIMIRIKDVVPGIVTETLKSQVSVLSKPSNSPKEKELLLRLFLSSLSSASVLKEIHNTTGTSGTPIIQNLRHVSVECLLNDYIRIENGILDVQNLEMLQSVVNLIIRIALESPAFFQTEIVEQMLNRAFQKDTDQSCILLSGVYSILQYSVILLMNIRSASYILTNREIDQLITCYSTDVLK